MKKIEDLCRWDCERFVILQLLIGSPSCGRILYVLKPENFEDENFSIVFKSYCHYREYISKKNWPKINQICNISSVFFNDVYTFDENNGLLGLFERCFEISDYDIPLDLAIKKLKFS